MYSITNHLFDRRKYNFAYPVRRRGSLDSKSFEERTIKLDNVYSVSLQLTTGSNKQRYISFRDENYHTLCYIYLTKQRTEFMIGNGKADITKEQFYDLVKGFSFSAMEWLLWNTL